MLKLRRSLAWILIVLRLLFLAGCSVAPSAVSPPPSIESTASPAAYPTGINAPTPLLRPELGSRTVPPTPVNGIVIADHESIDGLALHVGDTLELLAAAGDSTGQDISSQIVWSDHTGTPLGTGATLSYLATTTTMETLTAQVGSLAVRVSFTVSPLDVTVADHVKVLPEDATVTESSPGVWEITTGTTPLPTLYVQDVVVGTQILPMQIATLTEISPSVLILTGSAALPNQVIRSGTASFSQEMDWSGDSGEVVVVDQPPVPFHLADVLTPKWSGFVQGGDSQSKGLRVTTEAVWEWHPTYSGSIEFDHLSGIGLKRFVLTQSGTFTTTANIKASGNQTWISAAQDYAVGTPPPQILKVIIGGIPILIELDPTINLWVDPFVTVHPEMDMTLDYQLGSFNVTNTYENEAWSYQIDPGGIGTLFGRFEDDSDFAGLMVFGVRPSVQIQLWGGIGTENELQADVDGLRLPTVQVGSTQAGNTIQGTVQGFEQTQIIGKVSLKTGVSSPSPVPLRSDRIARQTQLSDDLRFVEFIAGVLGAFAYTAQNLFDSMKDWARENPNKKASEAINTIPASDLEEVCRRALEKIRQFLSPSPTPIPTPTETPRTDKIEEDQVPQRLYLNTFTGTTKWKDNGFYNNDGDRIKVVIYPEVPSEWGDFGVTPSQVPIFNSQPQIRFNALQLGQQLFPITFYSSGATALKSYINRVEVTSVSSGQHPPTTVGYQIDNAKDASSDPLSPGAKGTLYGSKALEMGASVTFLLECRDEEPTASNDSDELARNMRANKNIINGQPVDLPPSLMNKGYFGKPQPCLTQTHHIVPTGDYSNRRLEVVEAIQESKQILSDYKIDINSAANGVYLPFTAGLPIPGPVHQPVHTDDYFLLVRNRLDLAVSSNPDLSSVILALFNIGKDLVNGTIQP